MKKIYTTLFAAAAIAAAAASCGKTETEAVREGNDEIKADISVASLTPDTRAIKSKWEKGDIINVWLDDTDIATYKAKDGPDFTLTYDGSKWTAAGLSGKESRLKATGGKLRGFWEASNSCFNTKTDWSYNDVLHVGKRYCNVQFPDKDKNNKSGIKICLVADFNGISYAYDKDSKILTADINVWHFVTDFQLVVTGITITGDKGYALYASNVNAFYSVTNEEREDVPIIGYSVCGNGASSRIAGIENTEGVAFVGQWFDTSNIKTFTLVAGYGTEYQKEYMFMKEDLTLDSENGSKVIALKIPFSEFTEVAD